MLSVGFRAEIFPSAEDFLVSYTRGKTTCMIVDGHMPVTKSPRLKNSFVGTRTMEYAEMNGLNPDASRIGLGTWSIGGFMWGGTDEQAALKTILGALEHRITLLTRLLCMASAAPKNSSVELGAIWQAPRSDHRNQGRIGMPSPEGADCPLAIEPAGLGIHGRVGKDHDAIWL